MGLMRTMELMGRIGIICGMYSDNFIISFIAASFTAEAQKKFGFWEPKKGDFCIFYAEF
jgi:hypothetical protein